MGLQGSIAVNLLDVAAPLEILRPGKEWEHVAVSHARASGPDHLLGIEHLVDCLQTGAEPILSAEHAVHVIEIVEKAAQSARNGRAYTVESSL